MRSLLALSALSLFGILAAPFPAGAITPASAGNDCTTLGATQWAADNTGLLGCGLVTGNPTPPANVCNTPNTCKWKPMSGGTGCANCPDTLDVNGMHTGTVSCGSSIYTYGSGGCYGPTVCINGTWVYIRDISCPAP